MLVVFLPIFVADTIIFLCDFVAPLRNIGNIELNFLIDIEPFLKFMCLKRR